MDLSPDVRIGERLRFDRQARGKTQAVVAGLAGVTDDYLSQGGVRSRRRLSDCSSSSPRSSAFGPCPIFWASRFPTRRRRSCLRERFATRACL